MKNRIVDKFSLYLGLGFEEFLILPKRKLVILILFIDFVIALVLELAEHHPEEHAHVGMIMQRHLLTFLDEEKHEPVIITAFNGDPVEIFLKVIRIVWTINA